MKVKGFIKDVGGASRVTEARGKAMASANSEADRLDPIGETARSIHPGVQKLVVVSVNDSSKTSRTIRFESKDGHLPYFKPGQYVSINTKIGDSVISRPYSISSSPKATLGEHPYIEITIRKTREGFAGNYLYENVKVGDEFLGYVGLGVFTYEPLRDAKHVLALAGGSGITPFLSMARAVEDGILDCDLTILYGSVNENDIVLKDELDKINCPRVKIVHVLSGNNPNWTGEKGMLDSLRISRFLEKDSTIFICGPQAMYRFLEKELKKLNIPERRIRREVFGSPKDVTLFPDYPKEKAGEIYSLTVKRGIYEQVIPARANEPIAVAIERAGILFPTDCRSGACGFCRSKVLSGEVYVSPENDGRRAADKDYGYFHLCSTYPLSDVTVKIAIV